MNLEDLKQPVKEEENELPKDEKAIRDETDRLLAQLEKENGGEIKPLSPTEVASQLGLKEKKEEPKVTNSIISDAFNSCSIGIARAKKEMDENIEKERAKIEDAKLEKELDTVEDANIVEGTEFVYNETGSVELSDFDIDTEDLDVEVTDEVSVEDELKTEDESIEEFKHELKTKVKPFSNTIDLNAFKVSKKAVPLNTALKVVEKDNVEQWLLVNEKRPANFKELSGLAIEKLGSEIDDRNLVASYGKMYKEIYDHIIDPNKPKTLEEWTKVTKFSDLRHIYFGLYKATFKGRNYIPYDCEKCNNKFVSENIDMKDMYKFKDKKVEEEMMEILRNGSISSTNEDNKIHLVRRQVSDKYVIDFRVPSIYNIIFENSILPEAFRTKYANLLSVLSFIEEIYFIDMENSQLLPIECKIYPKNTVKTLEDRIVRYAKILRSLNSDQITQITAYVDEIDTNDDTVAYQRPECTCPKCGATIPAMEISPDRLLFTRHRLVTIANS